MLVPKHHDYGFSKFMAARHHTGGNGKLPNTKLMAASHNIGDNGKLPNTNQAARHHTGDKLPNAKLPNQ